jgi:hypothetical protein
LVWVPELEVVGVKVAERCEAQLVGAAAVDAPHAVLRQ